MEYTGIVFSYSLLTTSKFCFAQHESRWGASYVNFSGFTFHRCPLETTQGNKNEHVQQFVMVLL